MQTRVPFVLPRGWVGPDGKAWREGEMRLATARDEIFVLGDPRVKANRAYAVILLIARVVTRLGPLGDEEVTPEVVEDLYASDLAHLQEVYRRANGGAPSESPAGESGQGESV